MDTFDYIDTIGCHGTSGQEQIYWLFEPSEQNTRGIQAHKDSQTQARTQSQIQTVSINHVMTADSCFHFFFSYLLFVWLGLCFWWLDYQNATKHFPAFLGYLSWQQPCLTFPIKFYQQPQIYSLLASVSLSSQASGEKQQTEACWHNFD